MTHSKEHAQPAINLEGVGATKNGPHVLDLEYLKNGSAARRLFLHTFSGMNLTREDFKVIGQFF